MRRALSPARGGFVRDLNGVPHVLAVAVADVSRDRLAPFRVDGSRVAAVRSLLGASVINFVRVVDAERTRQQRTNQNKRTTSGAAHAFGA